MKNLLNKDLQVNVQSSWPHAKSVTLVFCPKFDIRIEFLLWEGRVCWHIKESDKLSLSSAKRFANYFDAM